MFNHMAKYILISYQKEKYIVIDVFTKVKLFLISNHIRTMNNDCYLRLYSIYIILFMEKIHGYIFNNKTFLYL